MTEQLTKILVFSGMLWLACWLWFYLWPALHLDEFRQDMFALRNEMFRDAASGKLAFNSEAYLFLRQTMNGYIRFGHRLSILQLVLAARFLKRPNFNEMWQMALAGANEQQKDLYNGYMNRMNEISSRYLRASSPVLGNLLFICVVIYISVKTMNKITLNKMPPQLNIFAVDEAYRIGSLNLPI